MEIQRLPLPKNCFRTGWRSEIDTLVLHYISAVNLDRVDPFNQDLIINIFKDYKISAHYLIQRDGETYKLVPDLDTAWHAGKSNLRGRSIRGSCNDFSIGIELVGGKWIDFTEQQYDSLIFLTKRLRNLHTIPFENIVGHENIAPGRKFDPGPHFDWKRYMDLLHQDIHIEPEPPVLENNITVERDYTWIERILEFLKSIFMPLII